MTIFYGGSPPEDNCRRVKGRRKGRSGTGTGTICCCAVPPEVPEVLSKGEVAVLAVLKKEFTGLTVSQIARFLRKLYPELSKRQRQKKVHRILNKLEKKNLVKTETIGNFRFAKITLSGVLFLAKVADKIDLFLYLLYSLLARTRGYAGAGGQVVELKYSWKLKICKQPELPSPVKSHDGTVEAPCVSER